MEYSHVDVVPLLVAPYSGTGSQLTSGALKLRGSWRPVTTCTHYKLCVGDTPKLIECSATQVLRAYQNLTRDPKIAEELQVLETKILWTRHDAVRWMLVSY